MVFFTCIIIVFILYYLQSDGLIFVTIIALLAELINIFLTQTMTKSAENKQKLKYGKIVDTLKKQVKAKNASIEELKRVHEESARVLYKANMKIKEYESKLGITSDDDALQEQIEAQASSLQKIKPGPGAKKSVSKTADDALKRKENGFDDLPPGSNRKQMPT